MDNDVFRSVIKLRWDNHYDEALQLYRQQVHGKYPLPEVTASTGLLNAVIDCLKLTSRVVEAVKMAEIVWELPEKTEVPEKLAVNICWLYITAFDQNKNHNIPVNPERSAFIAKLMKQAGSAGMHIPALLMFRYLEWLENYGQNQFSDMLMVLQGVSPGDLSAEEQQAVLQKNGTGKTFALASDREKWYAWITKVLYKLEKYQPCIEFCSEAFKIIEAFHHGNQTWLARRMALAFRQTGDLARAVHEFERLAAVKKDWFIQKELAELYWQQQDKERAAELFRKAVISQGYSEYKAGLFQLAGELFAETDRLPDGLLLLWMAARSREEQKWKLPERLTLLLQTAGQPEPGSALQLYKKLTQSWKNSEPVTGSSTAEKQQTMHTQGTITRILHPGSQGDGFITSHEGISVYFRAGICNFELESYLLKCPVTFVAKQKEHNGKNVWNAVKVYLVKEDNH